LDAITSAIVGRFFEVGQFETMGIPSEAQLIVPKTPYLTFDIPPVICLSGKPGSGKSVAARYLALYYGFKWVKINDLVTNHNINQQRFYENDRVIVQLPEKISEYTAIDAYICPSIIQVIIDIILNYRAPIIVDSLPMIYIYNISKLIRHRLFVCHILRQNKTGNKPFNNFINTDKIPLLFNDKQCDDLDYNSLDVDLVINNNSSLDNFRRLIDDSLFQIVQICS